MFSSFKRKKFPNKMSFSLLKTPPSFVKSPSLTTPKSFNLESLRYSTVCTINDCYFCAQDPLGSFLLVQTKNHEPINECSVSDIPEKNDFIKDAIPKVNGIAFIGANGTKIINYVNGSYSESTLKYSNRLTMIIPVLTITQIQSDVKHAIESTEEVTANITNRINNDYNANVEKLRLLNLVPRLKDASSITMIDSGTYREVASHYYDKHYKNMNEAMNAIRNSNNNVYRMMLISEKLSDVITLLSEVELELEKMEKTIV